VKCVEWISSHGDGSAAREARLKRSTQPARRTRTEVLRERDMRTPAESGERNATTGKC
jgi:hypothetical protein